MAKYNLNEEQFREMLSEYIAEAIIEEGKISNALGKGIGWLGGKLANSFRDFGQGAKTGFSNAYRNLYGSNGQTSMDTTDDTMPNTNTAPGGNVAPNANIQQQIQQTQQQITGLQKRLQQLKSNAGMNIQKFQNPKTALKYQTQLNDLKQQITGLGYKFNGRFYVPKGTQLSPEQTSQGEQLINQYNALANKFKRYNTQYQQKTLAEGRIMDIIKDVIAENINESGIFSGDEQFELITVNNNEQ